MIIYFVSHILLESSSWSQWVMLKKVINEWGLNGVVCHLQMWCDRKWAKTTNYNSCCFLMMLKISSLCLVSQRVCPKITGVTRLTFYYSLFHSLGYFSLPPSLLPQKLWFTATLPLLPELEIPFSIQPKRVSQSCKVTVLLNAFTDYLDTKAEWNAFSWLTYQEGIHSCRSEQCYEMKRLI